jgi:hypothetical protein
MKITNKIANKVTKTFDINAVTFVEKVKMASHKNKRLAFVLGAIAGGFVPVASYVTAHYQLNDATGAGAFVAWLMVIGGLIYSALSVYDFGVNAFGSKFKAFGFVLLTELLLVFGTVKWVSIMGLLILIGINSVVAGVNLSMEKEIKK